MSDYSEQLDAILDEFATDCWREGVNEMPSTETVEWQNEAKAKLQQLLQEVERAARIDEISKLSVNPFDKNTVITFVTNFWGESIKSRLQQLQKPEETSDASSK